jgi:5'-3' exonuclease
MGIPNYFVQLIKQHSNIIKKFSKDSIKINNLYIDSNSIIYDAINNIVYNNDNTYNYKLYKYVSEKLDEYIKIVNPNNKIIIAFDGIAPVAKLEQQRNRRYKSWFQNNNIDKWDTCNITPGTKFMNELNKYIDNHFKKQNIYKNIEIIISGSNIIGEGEHKIFNYIRNNKEYHRNTNTIIYGLDADLIMLCLSHLYISSNIYLFRETPHFINSLNNNLFPEEKYLLDIYELCENIKQDMLCDINTEDEYILDYIFICFMLGNDFLPHFPVLNLRTNGLTYIIETYKNIVSINKDYIIKNNKINWKIFKKIISELSINEEKYGIEEMKIRNKMEKKIKQTVKEEDRQLLTPILERKLEKYINIGTEGWQYRYYKELFDIEINDERRKQICINYLEGLEWTFNYYTNVCYDWRWKYNYEYPPLLEDLNKFIPYFETEFIEKKNMNNINEFTQLAYVLPRNSLKLLPENLYKYLILNHEDWYKLDYSMKWSYCKYFWESHVVMPDIDIELLEKIISKFIVYEK